MAVLLSHTASQAVHVGGLSTQLTAGHTAVALTTAPPLLHDCLRHPALMAIWMGGGRMCEGVSASCACACVLDGALGLRESSEKKRTLERTHSTYSGCPGRQTMTAHRDGPCWFLGPNALIHMHATPEQSPMLNPAPPLPVYPLSLPLHPRLPHPTQPATH